MLRHLLHGFLVGGFLVSATSAQNCSVCGDGYQVGSPSTVASVRCSALSDSPCTCNDLQYAGLQGLIAIEKCSNISSLIFETCNCKRNTAQNTNKSWNPTSPPGLRPVTTPGIAPYYHPNPAGPVGTRSSYPAPDAFRPTTSAPTEIAEPTLLQRAGVVVFFFVYATCMLFLLYAWCQFCIGELFWNWFIGRIRSQTRRDNSRRNIQATQQNLPMPTVTGRGTLERRPLVLAVLFPNKIELEGQGTPGGCSLKYDPQSKQYVVSEDNPDAISCSICLDFLAPEGDTVTGLCSHVYHRECIMNWFQNGHDECPNCRQPMWDPETYNMVDQSIQDRENNGLLRVWVG